MLLCVATIFNDFLKIIILNLVLICFYKNIYLVPSNNISYKYYSKIGKNIKKGFDK